MKKMHSQWSLYHRSPDEILAKIKYDKSGGMRHPKASGQRIYFILAMFLNSRQQVLYTLILRTSFELVVREIVLKNTDLLVNTVFASIGPIMVFLPLGLSLFLSLLYSSLKGLKLTLKVLILML